MQHIAIMNKKWGLIPRILSGQKKIESRWYVHKVAPWNKISAGDIVWFKDSGCMVTARAEVVRVLQFEDINGRFAGDTGNINSILNKYGRLIDLKKEDFKKEAEEMTNKNYCILVFLKNAVSIKPFAIDKSGFGNACAWMCVEDVEKIKL